MLCSVLGLHLYIRNPGERVSWARWSTPTIPAESHVLKICLEKGTKGGGKSRRKSCLEFVDTFLVQIFAFLVWSRCIDLLIIYVYVCVPS